MIHTLRERQRWEVIISFIWHVFPIVWSANLGIAIHPRMHFVKERKKLVELSRIELHKNIRLIWFQCYLSDNVLSYWIADTHTRCHSVWRHKRVVENKIKKESNRTSLPLIEAILFFFRANERDLEWSLKIGRPISPSVLLFDILYFLLGLVLFTHGFLWYYLKLISFDFSSARLSQISRFPSCTS